MPHALLIAAIFVPYAALMLALGLHLWSQVRERDVSGEPDDVRQGQVSDGSEEGEPPEPARRRMRLVA
jgi:hypothetical protein